MPATRACKIFAYDAEITEPCAYNIAIDQEEAGRVTAEWLVEQAGRQGRHHCRSPAFPALRSTSCAPRPRRKSSPSTPTSRSSARPSACGARLWPAPNSPRSWRPKSWDDIDGLWMQVGCYTANAMQLEAGKTAEQTAALRRRRLERRPHPDAAGRHRGRRRIDRPMHRWAHRAFPTRLRPIRVRWP